MTPPMPYIGLQGSCNGNIDVRNGVGGQEDAFFSQVYSSEGAPAQLGWAWRGELE